MQLISEVATKSLAGPLQKHLMAVSAFIAEWLAEPWNAIHKREI